MAKEFRFVVGFGYGDTPIISGKEIFRMKDEIGIPLSVSFQEIENRGAMIDWVGLIETAREHGWWDYQTYDAINEAFTDSGSWTDKREGIIKRFKAYVVAKPHPAMDDSRCSVPPPSPFVAQ